MKPNDNPPANGKNDILIVVGDDGNVYKLNGSDWKKPELVITDPQALGVINQMANYGVLLADMPDDLAIADGLECKLVNVKALSKLDS